MRRDQQAPDAVLALVAGLLHELHPAGYDPAQHPVDPDAVRDAEQLVAGLVEQGITITPT